MTVVVYISKFVERLLSKIRILIHYILDKIEMFCINYMAHREVPKIDCNKPRINITSVRN